MKYIEKVMQAIKVDRELLTEGRRRRITTSIEHMICDRYCPHEFLDIEDLSPNCDTCCEDCWNQEAK